MAKQEPGSQSMSCFHPREGEVGRKVEHQLISVAASARFHPREGEVGRKDEDDLWYGDDFAFMVSIPEKGK